MEKEKKKRGAQPGRVMTDAQREGLKKGFEALKAKREAVKAEKEGKKTSLPKPEELPIINLPITEAPANKPLVNEVPMVIEKVLPAKKTRNRVPAVSKNDFEAFKNDLYSKIQQQPVIQPVIQKPAEEVKQLLSGSALLNKIFFNK